MDTAVAVWLLTQVVAPDAYSRLVSIAKDKPQYIRLRRAVQKSSGVRPGRSYRRWLLREQTWADLVTRRREAYERLVDSLAEVESRRLLLRRVGDPGRAAKLVDATIAHFLPTLDPSLATAVAEYRAEERHSDVMARLDAGTSFEERLTMLPPAARRVLKGGEVGRGVAERLVDAVVRNDPKTIIASLLAEPPPWFAEASADIQLAAAELAQSYGLRAEAAQFYTRAADLGLDRGRNYARAAVEYAAAGQDRGMELIRRARAAGEDRYIDIAEAALDNDSARILVIVDEDAALADPQLASFYALALRSHGDLDASIALLTEATRRAPGYTGIVLQLAQLLLERSMIAGTTSRARDLDSALQLAVHARDERRQWRGASGQAAEVACRAALMANQFAQVITLGSPQPHGEAWPEEAAEPEVQFCVAEAAIALGDHETARMVEGSASGFHQALISAVLVAASNAPQPDIDEMFGQAWDLVETEDDRVAFWFRAATAGVEPLPGQAELDQRGDDVPLLARCSQHIAQGRNHEAIGLLRPNRDSESARRLLADAYLRDGAVDHAVAELIDIAERFDNADHLVRGVEVLVGADRLEDGAKLADRTLPTILVGRPERNVLHEVGVAAAHNREDWRDMERRVRAWINDAGPDLRRRWLLVQALYNQADPGAAWRILQEHGGLQPQNRLEARLWIVLHAEHDPCPETLSQILAIAERFPNGSDVRAAAVNAFFLMGSDKGKVETDELARWQILIQQRATNPAPDDPFLTITVPTDYEGLVETFRPLLEPQAKLVEEWSAKVREGWPTGMLAVVSGRPYTSTLVHRAAGLLPIASPQPQITDLERRAALQAVDGTVIADLSVLTTAWYIRDRWPQLLSAFTRVELTQDSRRDAVVAVGSMRINSFGSLAWDTRAGRPVLQPTDERLLARLRTHTNWVNDVASTLSVHADSSTASTPPEPWMTTFQAAKTAGLPLWADDVGLRNLARNEGATSFGTNALLLALVETGQLTQNAMSSSIESLRDEYCQDFPLDPSWLNASAERDGWQPGPALTTFTRASTWSDLPEAFITWREIANRAGQANPAYVAGWIYAASVGITATVNDPTASQLVAGLIGTAPAAVRSDPCAFASCVGAAKTACQAGGLADPTEIALGTMFDLLTQRHGPEKAATTLARLGSELSDADRGTLRRILFKI